MAKRKRSKRAKTQIKTTTQRELSTITKTPGLLSRKRHKPFNIKLSNIEDDRVKYDVPRKINAMRAPVIYKVHQEVTHRKKAKRVGFKQTFRPTFTQPDETVICWRRKIRRAVMFAKKQTGKGSQAKKRLRRHSNISCRR